MAVEGTAWEEGVDLSSILSQEGMSDDDIKLALVDLLPKYEEVYGERLIGTMSVNTGAIQDSVMHDPEIIESHASWDAYHAGYLEGGRIPSHAKSDRWPVILSSDDEETILDGWHRFHCYCSDGAEQIPAIFFPEDHHLAARGLLAQDKSDPLAEKSKETKAGLFI